MVAMQIEPHDTTQLSDLKYNLADNQNGKSKKCSKHW